MPQTIQEYADWLDNRDIIWPQLPDVVHPDATPSLKPLVGIRAVVWSIYGTVLRISDGRLLHHHPQPIRMKIALEKTIEEFNMWQSMSRKPGAPWEYMLTQYNGVLETLQMRGTKQKGDFPEVDSAELWRTLIGRLIKNDYSWDEAMHGDVDDLSVKVAYFFHMRLQAIDAAQHVVSTLNRVNSSGLMQGLLSNAQPFTMAQMLRAFRGQGKLTSPVELFDPVAMTFSYQLGVRTPSKSLYRHSVRQFQQQGIEPHEVLCVGSRLGDELAEAKRHGMRTVLYAGDRESLQASKKEIRDPEIRPDRLITSFDQVLQILNIE